MKNHFALSASHQPHRLGKHLLTLGLLFAAFIPAQAAPPATGASVSRHGYIGFDANEYPGDAQLALLRKQFTFVGYWLNNPPGADHNPWMGKRQVLLENNFGFLVVFNGRLDRQILKQQKAGVSPEAFGRQDAALAIAAARREGFPPGTILFLDQEEGGRMLPEQAGYLLAWTEAVAAGPYKPGVYGSGQPVPDEDEHGRHTTITTIQDLRQQVAAKHLHPIDFWVAQDACPPAPGCVIEPSHPPSVDLSGTLNATAWQFAQSPRRPSITRACAATYAHDGNCYPAGMPHFQIDLNASNSPDPSHGR